MNEISSGLPDRARDLWENTDFTATLFGSLTGYAVMAADFDGNVIAYNEGARQVYGYTPHEVCGKQNVEAFFPADFVEAGHFQRAVEVLLATGRFAYEGEKVRKGGERFPAQVLFSLTKDRAGNVVGFVEIVQDLSERKRAEEEIRSHRDSFAKANQELRLEIAERKRAERRLEAQYAITRVLAQSIRLADAAPRILQAICESLGWDGGALWCVDTDANVLRCVQVWPPSAPSAPDSGSSARPLSDERRPVSGVAQGLDFLRTSVADDVGLRDAIGFPINSGPDFLGVIELFSREGRAPSEDLLQMMSSICEQISQFIERTRAEKVLREKGEELRVARRIQEGLLPTAAPELPGFEIYGVSHSAKETGGDYFDFLAMPDSRQGIVVADASGHGIGPALLITTTRAYLRAFAPTNADVGTVLSLVNRRLTEDVGEDNFVTLFLARLDPRTRSFVHASAGHVTGYILDGRGDVKTTLESTGLPLGIDRDADFPSAPGITLQPGELVVLLTDGIMEACSPGGKTLFGIERALTTIRAHRQKPPGEIVQALLSAVRDFCQNSLVDDTTAVIIKVAGGR